MREVIRRNCDVDPRIIDSLVIKLRRYGDENHKLKDEDHLGWTEIANQLGMSESSVRSKYAGNADKKAQRAKNIAETLKKEVDKKGKYNNMIANKPKERKAMLIANANIKAKIQEQGLDPNISEDKKVIKKISSVEMQRARDSVGASGRKSKVTFTDREWEAVQAGAISDNMLTKFLNSSDSDEIVKRAMPKNVTAMTSAKMSKANAMLRSGYSYAEIAKACGVPESTVYSALNK